MGNTIQKYQAIEAANTILLIHVFLEETGDTVSLLEWLTGIEGTVIPSAVGVKWPKDEYFTSAQSMSTNPLHGHTKHQLRPFTTSVMHYNIHVLAVHSHHQCHCIMITISD